MNRLAMTAAAALVACGGTQQGTTSITSTIQGITFDRPIAAASSVAIQTCGQSSNVEFRVVLSDAANSCNELRSASGQAAPVTVTLKIDTRGTQAGPVALAIGDNDAYSKLQAGLVSISITTVDEHGVATSSEATGGSIFFQSFDGDAISGSFIATLPVGSLTGTFSASGCHVPATECTGG